MDLSLQIIDELFRDLEGTVRYQYIRRDDISPYCSKNLSEGESPDQTRRDICDTASLQIWCLTSNHPKCIYFNEGI